MTRRRLGVLVVAAVAALSGTGLVPAHAATSPTPVPALPYAAGPGERGAAGGTGTAAGNTAVATRCNAGAALRSPQWYSLPAGDGGQVYARGTAAQYARVAGPVPVGLAFVDRSTGSVLRCATGTGSAQLAPVTPTATRPVDVVVFLPQPYEDQYGDGVQDTVRLWLDRTTGAPPANDSWRAARPISALPLRDQVDTSLATSDPDLSFDICAGYGSSRATAWWSYRATATRELEMAVTTAFAAPATYAGAAVGLARMTPTGPVPVAPTPDGECTDDQAVVRTTVQVGTDYLIAVFVPEQSVGPGLALGGRLQLDVGPPATLPSAPVGLGVTREDAQRAATIRWSPPASDGGAPVTGYLVARPGTDAGGGGPWSALLSATARSQRFTLLLPWTPYDLSVRAVTRVGTGPAVSTRVVLSAPTPSAPTGLTARAGSASAALTWTAPAQTGSSAITGYRIRRFAGTGRTLQATATVPATARTFTATGLTAGSRYSFDVTAVNASGPGNVSARSAAVTPTR